MKTHSTLKSMFSTIVLALVCVTALPLPVDAAGADKPVIVSPQGIVTSEPWYKDTSFTVDTFGVYTVDRGSFDQLLQRGFAHGTFGMGLGTTAWFGEHIGLRLDSVIPAVDNITGSFFDYSSLSVALRFPTTIRLDPYGLAGLGFDWRTREANTHAAVGAAFRVTDNVSFTGEYRHVFNSHARGGSDYAQIRAGLSYKF